MNNSTELHLLIIIAPT